ncbi:hypothetical protein [Micromonospora haikouensis]|uniref:hypothetical protein n=1 Tax=Micromonospora haikouensis TaxID=686309 RepID=UPI003D742DAA
MHENPTPPPEVPPARPVRPLSPMPGTGSGSRPGGPDLAPVFPAQTLTVADPLCGHVDEESHDETCTYWRMVACGELPGPEAYLVDGVHHLPPHLPGFAPLADPALSGGRAA